MRSWGMVALCMGNRKWCITVSVGSREGCSNWPFAHSIFGSRTCGSYRLTFFFNALPLRSKSTKIGTAKAQLYRILNCFMWPILKQSKGGFHESEDDAAV